MGNILTIREAIARAKAEGISVSESALRRWAKSGAIPIRRAGNKQLLFYPNLEKYLRCEDGGDNSPAAVAVGGIRRVDAI